MPIKDSRNFSKDDFFSGKADHYVDHDMEAQHIAIRGGDANVIRVIQDNRDFAAFLAVPLRGDFGMPVQVESALKYNEPNLYDFVYKRWPKCFDLEVVDMGWWESNGSTAGYEGNKAYIMLKRISDGEKFNFRVDSVGKDGRYCSLPDDFNMKTWDENKQESLNTFAEEFKVYENLWKAVDDDSSMQDATQEKLPRAIDDEENSNKKPTSEINPAISIVPREPAFYSKFFNTFLNVFERHYLRGAQYISDAAADKYGFEVSVVSNIVKENFGLAVEFDPPSEKWTVKFADEPNKALTTIESGLGLLNLLKYLNKPGNDYINSKCYHELVQTFDL